MGSDTVNTGLSLALVQCEYEAEIKTAPNAITLTPNCILAAISTAQVDVEGSVDWDNQGGSRGLFEVLPVSGHPEWNDGMLRGEMTIIIDPIQTGDADLSGDANWGISVGASWLEGYYLGYASGWHVTGQLSDESGNLTDVNEVWPAAIDVAVFVDEPTEVGNLHQVISYLNGGGWAVGDDAGHIWSFNFSSSSEVEIDD